jgi:flagellar protein FlaG
MSAGDFSQRKHHDYRYDRLGHRPAPPSGRRQLTEAAAAQGAARGTGHRPRSRPPPPSRRRPPSPAWTRSTPLSQQLNKSRRPSRRDLEFSVDNDSKRTVVKVIDQTTKEVLRQIPTPEALESPNRWNRNPAPALLIQQTA